MSRAHAVTLSDTADGMREVVGKGGDRARRHGRSPRFLMSIQIVITDSEDDAWARADAIRDAVAATMNKLAVNAPAAKAYGFKRTADLAARGDRLKKCFWNEVNQLRGGQSNSGALVGTSEQLACALIDYYKVGVSAFILRGFDPVDDVIAISRDLIPLLREKVADRDAQVG